MTRRSFLSGNKYTRNRIRLDVLSGITRVIRLMVFLVHYFLICRLLLIRRYISVDDSLFSFV